MVEQVLNSKLTNGTQGSAHSVERALTTISSLVGNLDEVAQSPLRSGAQAGGRLQNQLAQVRLGVASSLFLALRTKHPPSADHCLRVAMVCSSWAVLMNLGVKEQDELEVAALLHDIGKIGVPDQILQKPGKLSDEESVAVIRSREHAREILTVCCTSREVLDIIYYSRAWYNGRKGEFDRCREQLPLGARVLAIADAFDSMTTDHLYRRAFSREQALNELLEHADTQFDPHLVKQFDYYLRSNHEKLSGLVARRWLQDLRPSGAQQYWQLSQPLSAGVSPVFGSLFHEHLLDTMHDGVVFVDAGLRILKWNRAIQFLTGISSAKMEQQLWDPAVLQWRDEHFKLITADRCPVIQAIRNGARSHKRILVSDGKCEKISIDACVSPVLGADGAICGATLLLQDASSRVSLEERLETLNERASQDGLTGVANRAEFDRAHQRWVALHLERGLPYSLVICDLDFFKRTNDTYGHQAGDEALIAFATLLRKYCRAGDMVARYGGEEFVMLCWDCDAAAAAGRAETIREAWSRQPHPMLNGKCLTASFGVTELQAGDTGETMLRRADGALLQAKSEGRNTVVQLGGPRNDPRDKELKRRHWLSWWRSSPGQPLLQRRVVTVVPLQVAAEKLRGFVADHGAEIIELKANHVMLEIAGQDLPTTRRKHDRPTPFLVELDLEEIPSDGDARSAGTELRTAVQVTVRPKRQRDRRRHEADERARHLFVSLKSQPDRHERPRQLRRRADHDVSRTEARHGGRAVRGLGAVAAVPVRRAGERVSRHAGPLRGGVGQRRRPGARLKAEAHGTASQSRRPVRLGASENTAEMGRPRRNALALRAAGARPRQGLGCPAATPNRIGPVPRWWAPMSGAGPV